MSLWHLCWGPNVVAASPCFLSSKFVRRRRIADTYGWGCSGIGALTLAMLAQGRNPNPGSRKGPKCQINYLGTFCVVLLRRAWMSPENLEGARIWNGALENPKGKYTSTFINQLIHELTLSGSASGSSMLMQWWREENPANTAMQRYGRKLMITSLQIDSTYLRIDRVKVFSYFIIRV